MTYPTARRSSAGYEFGLEPASAVQDMSTSTTQITPNGNLIPLKASAGDVTLTGVETILPSVDGHVLTLFNIDGASARITLKDAATGSSSKVFLNGPTRLVLRPGWSIRLIYSSLLGGWAILGPPFRQIASAYNPDLPPSSPSATDDEFDDELLSADWTSFGTPDTLDETALQGFLKIEDNDGTDCGVYKGYVPGAAALTVACCVSGDVSGAGSNQVLMGLRDSGGSEICRIGMLNGSAYIAAAAAFGGGFTSGNVTYITPNVGKVYFAITRDATTNYSFYVSGDGIIWKRVATCSQAGTIARLYLHIAGFGGSTTTAYYDFVRMFTSQTTKIGDTP